MTDHINYYTSTATRPAPTSGTTTKVGSRTPKRPRRGWKGPAVIAVGAAVVVGAGALAIDSITESDSPGVVVNDDPGRSQRLVQESIDAALADAGRAPAETRGAGTPVQLPGGVVIEHLDGGGQASESDPGRSQRLVQESIDAALAEAGQDSVVTSYDAAEANRMSTLHDLHGAGAGQDPVAASYDVAEANRMSTLHDLHGAGAGQDSVVASYDAAEANRMSTLQDL